MVMMMIAPGVPHGSKHGPEAVGGGALEGVAGAEGCEQCEEEEEEEEDGRPPSSSSLFSQVLSTYGRPPGEEADQEGQGDRPEDDGEQEEGEAEAEPGKVRSCAGLELVEVEDGGEDGEEGDEDGGQLDVGKVLLLSNAKFPPEQLEQQYSNNVKTKNQPEALSFGHFPWE